MIFPLSFTARSTIRSLNSLLSAEYSNDSFGGQALCWLGPDPDRFSQRIRNHFDVLYAGKWRPLFRRLGRGRRTAKQKPEQPVDQFPFRSFVSHAILTKADILSSYFNKF